MQAYSAPLRDALLAARRNHQALDLAPHREHAVPDAESAFALQHAQGVARGEWAPGELPRHWKSGAPNRQATLVHAPLLPSGVMSSQGDARRMAFFAPGMEAEIALRLGRDVTPADAAALSHEQAGDWVDAMAVSLEVVDSRWADPAHTPPLLKLADFQVHGALVLGEWQPWRALDWQAQRGHLRIGAAEPIAFQGSHTLGTPQWLLPIWLRHLTRHGATVPAGTVVTTGAWCGCVPTHERDIEVQVAFEGIGQISLLL